MLGKKIAVALAGIFMLGAFCACDPAPQPHTVHVDADKDGKCDECGTEIAQGPVAGEPFDVKQYEDLPVVQFSSVQAVQEEGNCVLKMRAPWTDTFQVTYSEKAVEDLRFYSEQGEEIATTPLQKEKGFELSLQKGQIVYACVDPVKTAARFTVKGVENSAPLPFDLAEAPDPSGFSTTDADPSVDPLEPAELNYEKRKDTLYVYSNAPETLMPEAVNVCITRQPVSNKSVYFTFEHQSREVGGVYYGYRVTNTGTEDMYVTVKNIGFQFTDKGAYLGQKEWIDFYNTNFALPDFSDLSESQMRLYKGYYDFAENYILSGYQPTTYRIPAGKYMYVMGGTTSDSFGGFNVASTANKMSNNAICENGAVLFDVVGEAEGAFYIYNDIGKVVPGGEGYDTHQGGWLQPAASCGWDEGYVIDNQATWIFNDATPAQALPVNYTNYYSDEVGTSRVEGEGGVTGTPNAPIEGTKEHRQLNRTEWVTHIDVQQHHEAIGKDVTLFHTVDKNGNPIVYGCNYYDSVGKLPNMGNWMKDLQDIFTFVNRGDKARTVRINITPNGCIPVMLRTMDGKRVMDEGLKPFFAMFHGSDKVAGVMEDGFDKACHYEIVIPPHTVKQIAVEYNLMANSSGFMRHSVDLI